MPCCSPMLAALLGILQQATYAKFTKPGESTKQTPPVHVRGGCCDVLLCSLLLNSDLELPRGEQVTSWGLRIEGKNNAVLHT